MLERLKKSPPARIFERYSAADAGLHATSIAYNALFSFFPIVLALIFILGQLLPEGAMVSSVGPALAAILPPDAAAETNRVLETARQESGIVGLVSLLGLFWAGSALFGALAKAFNRIYGVKDRPLWRQQIMSAIMIFVFGTLLLLSVGLGTVAQLLLQFAALLPYPQLPGLATIGSAVSFLLSFASALALFLAIFIIVPNVRLSLGDVWPGALLGAVLFVLMVQVFPLYVRLIANFARYGAFFGFALLLLTWLYFIAQVFLIGAALNATHKPAPEAEAT